MKSYVTILFLLIINLTTYAQFLDSETDGKYIKVNGAKLWTLSFGEGDPLFFIAGGPGGTHYNKINILGHSYGGVVAQGYAIKYPENVSHLIIANSFHSYLMWQENCDNSNHEIKTNYPEVWEELMKVREQGAVSSDKVHYEIYGRVPYGFLYAYNPEKFKPS